MPLFTASADLFTMQSGKKIDNQIEKFQRTVMGRAVGVFLKACQKRIPYRTGFVRGSFRALNDRFARQKGSADLNPLLAQIFSEHETVDDFGNRTLFNPRKAIEELEESAYKKLSKDDKKLYGQRIREAGAWDKKMFRRARRKGKFGFSKDQRYREWYYTGPKTRIEKTPSSGVQFVTPPDQVLKTNGTRTTVNISNTISYFRINDNFSKIRGAPWRAMEAGFMAMLNYIEIMVRKYPILDELLIAQRIKLEGDKVTKRTVADYRRRFYPTKY